MSTEKLTRKEIIDNRLKKAGWLVGDLSQVVEEFDIIVDENLAREATSPYGGHQYSDYVLLGKDGKPLAVVEAKKTSDAASKASTLFLCHYFNKNGIVNAKKNLVNTFGKKHANYYTNKFKHLNKNCNQTNKYQQELLQNVQYQLTQILGSIPSL